MERKNSIFFFAKSILLVVFLMSASCEKEEFNESAESDIKDDSLDSLKISSDTPWDFDSEFASSDDFQADNDGNGAHNWDEDDYINDPVDNNFDIRDFIYVDDDDRLILQCPNGNGVRRAEFRDQENIDLNDEHGMDFTFDVVDYNNEDELIMAQLHNDDSDARRPYITVVAEDGEIRLQRTDAPTGSSTTRASETIPFETNDRYRITIITENNTRNTSVSIRNLDTGDEAENTFSFASAWDDLDGNFYWKFGAYMPDGGSDDTRTRVETISFRGQ